ncbi:MAG: alpha/beta hydrolase [Deltaproteobacteria bacterium]|nr:alpha/beta hydrolase [Deltaproteobacteria bacterium]
MERWIGDLLVDTFPSEKSKFRSVLVLVHGLWSDSSCWQPWATHFANLGWDCWAVNLRGRFGPRAIDVLSQVTFGQCVEDLHRVIRATPFPPVLLGHSFGGLIAQKVAAEGGLSALVLLSSVPPRDIRAEPTRTLRLLRLKYLPLLWLGRPFRLEDKDFGRSWLASVPVHLRAEIYRQAVPESGRLARAFFRRSVRIESQRIACPVLVIGGDADQVVDVAAQRASAHWLGADFQAYPGHGHAIMQEQGSERVVRDIHRWLVQRLGETILLADLGRSGSTE